MLARFFRRSLVLLLLALALSGCGPLPILIGIGVGIGVGVFDDGGGHHHDEHGYPPAPPAPPPPSPPPAPPPPPSPPPAPPPPPPFSLAFVVQPSQVKVGAFMEPLVQVEVLLADGEVDTSSDAEITIYGLDANGFPIEGGGAIVTAVNGIATVTSLVVFTPGVGHRLVARSSVGGGATSQPFDAILESAGSLSSAPWQPVAALAAPPALPVSFLIDAASPGTVYAVLAFEHGIWRSADGGSTWLPASLGLTDAQVGSLAIDPTDDQTLYCTTFGGGVFKSTNGAASWSWSSDGTGATVDGEDSAVFAVDPANPQVVFGTETGIGFNETTNGGAHWAPVSGLAENVAAFALSPADHELLYAATAGQGTFVSEDGGVTWAPTGLAATGAQAICFAADPVSTSVVYAGTASGVYASTDGGATFVAASSGITDPNIVWLAIDPGNPQTLYALASPGGAYVSMDGAASWAPLLAGASNDEAISVIAMNAANGLDLIAGTASGIWRTSNGGTSWVSKSSGIVTNALVATMEFAPSNPNTVYASVGTDLPGVTYAAFLRSSDAGATWTDVSAGLITPSPLTWIVAAAIDPVSSSTVYAGSVAGLSVSADGGATWTALAPGGGVLSIAIDPTTGTTLYAVVAETSGDVLRTSTDGGNTWSDANAGLPPATAVTIDPVHPSTLFALAGGLYRSGDGATTWTAVRAAATDSAGIDPLNDATVWASGLDAASVEQVLQSPDGGTAFSLIPTGYYDLGGSVAPDPLEEGTVYSAAGNRGLLKTTNGGASWAFARNGIWAAGARVIAFDPAHAGTLYASTGAGLFKTTTGGQ